VKRTQFTETRIMAILVIGAAAKRKAVARSQDWFQISERCRFDVDQIDRGQRCSGGIGSIATLHGLPETLTEGNGL